MNFDEYVTALENNTVNEYNLQLDFSINDVVERSHTISDEEDEELTKIGKRNVKVVTQTIFGLNEVTALHMAVIMNRPSVVKYLLAQGANPDKECGGSEHKFQEILEKKKKNHNTFWAPSDYSSQKHMVSHSSGRYTALEIAEILDNDCLAVLQVKQAPKLH